MLSLYGFRDAERRTGTLRMISADIPMITHDWRGNFVTIPVGDSYNIPFVPAATLVAGLELYLNSLELRSDPIKSYGYGGMVGCGYGVRHYYGFRYTGLYYRREYGAYVYGLCFPEDYFTVHRIAV
jgi:hypothetical protein